MTFCESGFNLIIHAFCACVSDELRVAVLPQTSLLVVYKRYNSLGFFLLIIISKSVKHY